jgi:hypothetical protein
MLNYQHPFRSDFQPPPPRRPLPLSLIVLFQFLKASLLLLVCVLASTGHESRLASIPDLRDLIFLASHGKAPSGLVLLVLGLYAAAIGYGLWNFRRWARNSLVFTSLLMLVLWFAHNDFGTALLTMPAFRLVETQTVYILLLLDFFIFMYLKFHSDTARCFPPKQRARA